MTAPVVEWTAPCPTCAGDATWRSSPVGTLDPQLGPLTFACPVCDVATVEPVTAPRVSAALACIARRMLYGAAS